MGYRRTKLLSISSAAVIAIGACLGEAIKARDLNPKNPFSESKVQIDFENLGRQKGLADTATFTKPSSANETSVPQGAELVALIDTACHARGDSGLLSRSVAKGQPALLDLQAYKWKLIHKQTLRELSAAAEADPCVLGVTENIEFKISGEFTNDTFAPRQAHLSALDADESYQFFWASRFKITEDVVIAILDTGIDYRHLDLATQMWRNAQGQYGYDFVNSTETVPDTDPMDDNGHGTHVAGLAAAISSNQRGVSGIMGFRAKLMAVKVMNAAGSGDLTTVINGVRYAVTNGANIVNLSIGGRGQNTAVRQGLIDAVSAGVTVIMAAGNESTQLTNTVYFSPASYGASIEGAVAVGAYDTITMDRASFSNYSTTFVEIGAPGANGTSGLASTYLDNQYVYQSGTSMASPIAAGAAALTIGFLKSRGLPFDPAIVEAALKGGSIKSAILANDFAGGNQLNLMQLTKYLQNSYILDGSAGLESE